MTKMLPKGAAMPISKGLQELLVRLAWDDSGDANDPMDVDGFIIGRDAAGKTVQLSGLKGHALEDGGLTPAASGYFIAPGNEFGATNPFDWIEPAHDERTGAASGWDEVSKLHLGKVPAEIVRLDVLIAIYPLKADGQTPNGHTFGMVNNCKVELANAADGAAVVQADSQFTNPSMWAYTGVWFVSIVRNADGSWKFVNVMFADAAKFTYYNDFMDLAEATIPQSNV